MRRLVTELNLETLHVGHTKLGDKVELQAIIQ